MQVGVSGGVGVSGVVGLSGLVGLDALLGSDTAFLTVFGVFVAAFVVLVVVTLRWAVRRDRVGRAEWLRRRSEADAEGGSPRPGPRA